MTVRPCCKWLQIVIQSLRLFAISLDVVMFFFPNFVVSEFFQPAGVVEGLCQVLYISEFSMS